MYNLVVCIIHNVGQPVPLSQVQRNVHHPEMKPLTFEFPSSPTPGNCWSFLFLYGFAYCGRFIAMESHYMSRPELLSMLPFGKNHLTYFGAEYFYHSYFYPHCEFFYRFIGWL